MSKSESLTSTMPSTNKKKRAVLVAAALCTGLLTTGYLMGARVTNFQSALPQMEKLGVSLPDGSVCDYASWDWTTSWTGAEAHCVSWGGHLMSIHFDEEYTIADDLCTPLPSHASSYHYCYIGFKHPGGNFATSTWSDGTPFDAPWHESSGRNCADDSQVCGIWRSGCMSDYDGDACAQSTSIVSGIICKRGGAPASTTYQVVAGNVDFAGASGLCAGVGGTLATLNTETVRDEVNALAQFGAHYWVGAHVASSVWTWDDGSAFDHSVAGANPIRNEGGACGAFYAHGDGIHNGQEATDCAEAADGAVCVVPA